MNPLPALRRAPRLWRMLLLLWLLAFSAGGAQACATAAALHPAPQPDARVGASGSATAGHGQAADPAPGQPQGEQCADACGVDAAPPKAADATGALPALAPAPAGLPQATAANPALDALRALGTPRPPHSGPSLHLRLARLNR